MTVSVIRARPLLLPISNSRRRRVDRRCAVGQIFLALMRFVGQIIKSTARTSIFLIDISRVRDFVLRGRTPSTRISVLQGDGTLVAIIDV